MNFYDVVETFGTKVWCVGGAVRDEIMGYEPKDCDYVVEATKEEFLKNFPNAKQVGSHFPIFLFDKDGESVEVALTRTEKSNGNGYHDFEVDKIGVSIEEDLFRRDFSINSIAKQYLTGVIVDPYGGQRDIQIGIVRTINPNSFLMILFVYFAPFVLLFVIDLLFMKKLVLSCERTLIELNIFLMTESLQNLKKL